ncbi:hypothetical protein EDB84DRAFT_1264100 [Lactarius hengduanensis]|nr:hypothetical protein EDB84DRAFT_1264100 [Lactarius hengduanensis]
MISVVPPPPTTNKLDSVQRTRVMRSSRKLGAVLGATPFLIESNGCSITATLHTASSQLENDHVRASSPMQIKRHRRQCSIVEEPPIHSELSPFSLQDPVLLAKCQRSADAPRPLFLYLNSTPLSPPDSDVPLEPIPLTPLSAKTEVPQTPTTPIEPSHTEARRRKMARVVRKLGENVPAELVFQSSDAGWTETTHVQTAKLVGSRSISHLRSAKSQRRRSASLGSNSQWQRLLELPAPVFSSGARAPEDQRWVGAWNRRNIAQVQRELRALRRR